VLTAVSFVNEVDEADCNDGCDELVTVESVVDNVLTVNLLLPFLVDVVASPLAEVLPEEEVTSLCDSERLELDVASLTMKRVAFFDGD